MVLEMKKTTPVWEATLDEIYHCTVERLNEYQGVLTIKKNNTRIYSTAVHLSYGAVFGPDVMDIAEWESICVNYVDNLNNKA